MRSNYVYILLAASTLALAGCSNDEMTDSTSAKNTQVITVNASQGTEPTRATYTEQGTGADMYLAFNWDATDKINLFADATNGAQMSCDKVNSANDATFSGSFATPLTQATPVTGAVDLTGVTTNGTSITTDLSQQTGTLADATAHTIMYGTGTYDPLATTPVNVKFTQKMSIIKYVLNFPDVASGTAQVNIKADGQFNKVILKTTNGSISSLVAGDINIASAPIADNKATVYVAVYPSAMKNITATAIVNGNYYTYTRKANGAIEANKVYSITRDMVKLEDTGVAADSYAGGDGTVANPYQIATAAQLRKMAAEVNGATAAKAYQLTQDIALSGAWAPIGTNASQMKGVTFDGGNHIIHGTINVSSVAANADGVGIFGVVSSNATVKDLIVDANITNTSSSATTGGIAGKVQYNGSIVHCQFNGQITSSSQFIGGIAGEAYATGAAVQQCLIEACTNTGSISSTTALTNTCAVGGIIGRANIASGASAQVIVKGCNSISASLGYTNQTSSHFAGGLCGTINNNVSNTNVQFLSCWCATDELASTARALSICSGSNPLFTAHAVFAKGISGVNLFRNSTMSTIDQGTTGTETECKTFSSATPWTANINNMNTVWNSPTYSFNSNGVILTK